MTGAGIRFVRHEFSCQQCGKRVLVHEEDTGTSGPEPDHCPLCGSHGRVQQGQRILLTAYQEGDAWVQVYPSEPVKED